VTKVIFFIATLFTFACLLSVHVRLYGKLKMNALLKPIPHYRVFDFGSKKHSKIKVSNSIIIFFFILLIIDLMIFLSEILNY